MAPTSNSELRKPTDTFDGPYSTMHSRGKTALSARMCRGFETKAMDFDHEHLGEPYSLDADGYTPSERDLLSYLGI